MTATTGADAIFRAELSAAAARAEAALDALLPIPDAGDPAAPIAAAMRHAALGGGKRLRAFLAIESAAICGAAPEEADRLAAAVEALHAYSLVHDDLPCMDDDDLRRGRPTVHKLWDEAVAVLAGDALQTFAFEVLADPATSPDPGARAALCLALARASGEAGMVGGQMLDIAAESAASPLTLPEIERIQAGKTGALIAFAARSGAVLAGAGEDRVAALNAYGAALGAAFQIADDLLDVTGDAGETGKRVGKDAAAGKATHVDLLGVEGARRRAAELVDGAIESLAPFGAAAAALARAARFAVERRA